MVEGVEVGEGTLTKELEPRGAGRLAACFRSVCGFRLV